MAHERLIDKQHQPSDAEMIQVIGPELAGAWNELRRFLVETYQVEPLMQCGGPKYGWNVQHRKGGRPLCEMYPEHGSFTAMVVLGGKERQQAMEQIDSFGALVAGYLQNTRMFHDGAWLYMRVSDPLTAWQDVQDIERLVLLKKKLPRQVVNR
jgi:hypothetical protein